MPEILTTDLFIFHCPECDEYFKELIYSVDTKGREWGRVSLETEEDLYHNSDESESGDWDGTPEYSCYDCGEIFTEDEIKANSKIITVKNSDLPAIKAQENYLEKIWKSKIKKGKFKPMADEKPESGAETSIFKENQKHEAMFFGAECPKCHTMFQTNNGESSSKQKTFPTCVECGKEFELKTNA